MIKLKICGKDVVTARRTVGGVILPPSFVPFFLLLGRKKEVSLPLHIKWKLRELPDREAFVSRRSMEIQPVA